MESQTNTYNLGLVKVGFSKNKGLGYIFKTNPEGFSNFFFIYNLFRIYMNNTRNFLTAT